MNGRIVMQLISAFMVGALVAISIHVAIYSNNIGAAWFSGALVGTILTIFLHKVGEVKK